MTVVTAPPLLVRPLKAEPALDWRGAGLATAGLVLTFAAPIHRLDLLLIGLAALSAGLVWSPMAGPLLTGAALPFFFFGRPLVGPLAVTPPGLALMVSWLAVIVRWRRAHANWPRTAYDAPLALLLVAGLLSLLVSEYPLLSVRELRALIFEPVLFFWLLHTLRGSPTWALWGFLAGATLTAVAAVAQGPLGIGGTAAEGVLRAQAWYPSANHLALMLGRAWPFFLAGAVGRWPLLWLPAAVVGLAIVLTFSTGGWLGALAATLVVMAMCLRRRTATIFGAAAALLLLAVSALAIGGLLPERLNPLRQTGGFRVDLWLSSIDMVRDHPLLGIGLDNFAHLYQQVYLRPGGAAEPNLSHPHNWLLNFWLELGVLGVVAFGWLLVRFWRQLRDGKQSWLAAGAAGAMVDLLVHGWIDNSYFLVDLAFLFWLCLALAARRLGDTANDESRIPGT